jgi:hypothetical protein
MHTVNMGTGEIVNVQIKRAKVLEHFANKQPCLIAIRKPVAVRTTGHVN